MDEPLYHRDFFRWTEQQAHALRAAAGLRVNEPIDWENLAEEVEDLGKSRRSELASRIQTIVEHLLKLQASPATEPRPSWRATVARERGTIEDLLEESPSLRNAVSAMLARATQRAHRVVEQELAAHGEASAKLCLLSYSEEQVLGGWFPEPSDGP